MAKEKEEALKKQEQQGQALAMMARPSFIEQSTAGTEGITADDVRMPRLAISQGLSSQMIPGDSTYIPDLKLFELFNDTSGEIYGKGPIKFIVLRRDAFGIEFDPNDRKIPVDFDVPLGDARLKWTKDAETGKGVPPVAIKFVEFAVMLLSDDLTPLEPILLSIKETNKFNKRAHERLTGFTKMNIPPAPIYAKVYSIEVGMEKNDKGTWGVPVLRQVSFIQDQELYAMAKKMHESLAGKVIVANRDLGGEDDFDTSAMDAAAGGENPGM